MVKGLLTFKKNNTKCEACIYGKQNRDAFPIGLRKENKHLKLVHIHICGPLENYLGVCKYFLLFIDYFS